MTAPQPRCTVYNGRIPPQVEVHTNRGSALYNILTRSHPAIENYDGVVIDYNRNGSPEERVVCTMPRSDEAPCGSIITNKAKNLRSHISDIHKEGSKYEAKQDKNKHFRCNRCFQITQGLNPFIAHCQRCHKFKGSYDQLRQHEVPRSCTE
ncbi:hypothetical protein GGS21DRAFT_486024 [Xylaria nigripes]|nr:hypothetical protein GGS21DRAFT_486024 [Xylaria nigripes]